MSYKIDKFHKSLLNDKYTYSFHVVDNNCPDIKVGDDIEIDGIWDYVDYSGDGNFDTYEEAQIKAIESILEIMEKKI